MATPDKYRSTNRFSEVHKERVGQLINYLALKVKGLYLTKLLKLLYIIDEESIVQLGTPITWLDYKVHKMGPVTEDIWSSIKDGNTVFGEYFDVFEKDVAGIEESLQYKVAAISKADLSEFSRAEQKIIDGVVGEYGKMPSQSLIDYLHREESLWKKIVDENEISFTDSLATEYLIDLTRLIDSDSDLMDIYSAAKEEIRLLESFS